MMNLDKIKYFDPAKLYNLASRHLTKFVKRVIKDGLDYKGRQFPLYSKGYLKLLEKDFKKKDGSRYAGYGNTPLSTSSTKRSKRQFELRGLTMGAGFGVRGATNDSYTIGWDGEPAAIVEGNARKGRNIIDDIPPDEMKWVLNELGKLVDGEWKKIPNVTRIKA